MNTYEIVNPSDPYTFLAPDIKVAGMAVGFISTQYAAKQIDGDEQSPIMFGWDEWMKSNGIDEAWIDAHRSDIADALDSVLIGSVRPDAPMSDEEREARHDKLRSSMNDIGTRARSLAAQLRSA